MTAISPKSTWVTDQKLNPWDEPKHYTLSDDLTTAAPYKKAEEKGKQAKPATATAKAGDKAK